MARANRATTSEDTTEAAGEIESGHDADTIDGGAPWDPSSTDVEDVGRGKLDDGAVLVLNRRKGNYQCLRTVPVELKGPNNQQRFRVTRLILKPGLNLVPTSDWRKLVVEGSSVSRRLDEGLLEEIGGPDDFMAMRSRRAVELVKDTADVEVLRALATFEKRRDVVEEIEGQLEEITTDRGTRARARGLQAAHTQRHARRRG
jgi:hypothetical protein